MRKGEVYFVGGKRIHEIFACCPEEAAACYFEGMFDNTADIDNIKVSRHLSLYRSKKFNRQKFMKSEQNIDPREVVIISDHTVIHRYVLENLISQNTAFKSSAELIQDAIDVPNYRPTMRLDVDKFFEVIADFYDDEMKKLGLEKRAYRTYPR